MAAIEYDFNITQGSSFKLTFIYKDKDGNPIDMTNWCARIIWTTNLNDIYIFSTENTNYSEYKFTLDGINGKTTLLIPACVTNEYNFSSARYDLEFQTDENVYPEGGKYTFKVLYGRAKIIKRYSKADICLECSFS